MDMTFNDQVQIYRQQFMIEAQPDYEQLEFDFADGEAEPDYEDDSGYEERDDEEQEESMDENGDIYMKILDDIERARDMIKFLSR